MSGSPQRRLFHVVERHDEPKKNPRKMQAWQSWDRVYERGVIPVHVWEYPRNARAIGDPRALPYMKDVLTVAMEQADDQDVIVFTNDDNWLHPELPGLLLYHVPVYGACSSFRCEFRNQLPRATETPEMFAKLSKPHIGRDLFAFTKEWLVKWWNEFPDVILGASDFDLHLASLIRLEKGIITTRKNIAEVHWPAEIQKGYVSHVWHAPTWMKRGNVDSAPSQIWNRRLFFEWASSHLPDLKFDHHKRI